MSDKTGLFSAMQIGEGAAAKANVFLNERLAQIVGEEPRRFSIHRFPLRVESRLYGEMATVAVVLGYREAGECEVGDVTMDSLLEGSPVLYRLPRVPVGAPPLASAPIETWYFERFAWRCGDEEVRGWKRTK